MRLRCSQALEIYKNIKVQLIHVQVSTLKGNFNDLIIYGITEGVRKNAQN